MYDRLNNLIDINILSSKNILLAGVGGVGSSCFEVLIRSGIKNITIIDFDTYELSNLNRQIHSNLKNINSKKVDVLKDYAMNINPDINITIIDKFLDKDTTIDFTSYDYIIDAVDSIEAKVLLIKNSIKYKIPFISSMGVGKRVNPFDLRVCMLDKVNGDPLAKKLKKALKINNIDISKVKCVASSEIPVKSDIINSYIGVSMYSGILLADTCIKKLLMLENK